MTRLRRVCGLPRWQYVYEQSHGHRSEIRSIADVPNSGAPDDVQDPVDLTGRKPNGTSPPARTTFRHRVVDVNPLARPCGAGPNQEYGHRARLWSDRSHSGPTATRQRTSSFLHPLERPGHQSPGVLLPVGLCLSPGNQSSSSPSSLSSGMSARRSTGSNDKPSITTEWTRPPTGARSA